MNAALAALGANLREGGATFRIWAPAARSVSVRGNFNNWSDCTLSAEGNGYWSASVDGVREGDQYLFYVDGLGSTGFKRDPHARALNRVCPRPPPPGARTSSRAKQQPTARCL
ncbi:hypothetical protein [Ensifer aridi]|uniref:hypothetical protein n=1 Tax=Ensifer aridi TaxID=1708715 RepID=UPI000A10666B